MDQATTTYGAVETGTDGSALGPIKVPVGLSRILSVRVAVTLDGAWTTVTGFVAVLKISGKACRQGDQELVVAAGHLEDGAGTLTYTTEKLIKPLIIPVDIPVIGGNELNLSAAYYAADPGSLQLAVTLEIA